MIRQILAHGLAGAALISAVPVSAQGTDAPIDEYQYLLKCTSYALLLGSIFHSNEDPEQAAMAEDRAQYYANHMNAYMERLRGMSEQTGKSDDEIAEDLAMDILALAERVQAGDSQSSEDTVSELFAVTEVCRSRYGV